MTTNFGWVKKTDTNYIVLADKSKYGTGYGVPFIAEGYCKYTVAEVEEYLKEHPEMEFLKYDDEYTEEQEIAKQELIEIEDWFNNFYDIQINQYNRCQRLHTEYTGKYTIEELDTLALKNSARIIELREILKN